MQSLNAIHKPFKTVYGDTQSEQHAKPPSASGSMGRFAVTLYNGTRSLVTSLSPNYLPDHLKTDNRTQRPATAHSPVKGNQQATFTASLFEGAGMACSLMGHWCPQVRVVADVTAKLCASVCLADELRSNMAGNPATSGAEHNKPKPRSPATTEANYLVRAAAVAVAVETLDRLAGAAAVPLPEDRGGRNNPIPVGDSTTLNKIGRNPDYPSDAFYIQTADISAEGNKAIGNQTTPFSGQYDGMCRTISYQQECLFKSLSGNVSNLHLSKAYISVREDTAAVVACQMSGSARIENVSITRSQVVTTGDSDYSLPRFAYAGIVTANQNNSEATRIQDVNVTDCSITTTGDHAFVGIGGGHISGEVTGLTVLNSRVTSSGESAYAGIGAGALDGQIRYLSTFDSQVATYGKFASAGIGCGRSDDPKTELSFITAIDSQALTFGEEAHAAIGAGEFDSPGQISDVATYDCNVHSGGSYSGAAVGAGLAENGRISNIKAINTTVTAEGESAPAGIGAGLLDGDGARLENITALNCDVKGESKELTGIPYGEHYSGQVAKNSIETYNTEVFDRIQGRHGINQSQLNHLCKTADSRFLTNDCRVANYTRLVNKGCEPLPLPLSPVPLAYATAASSLGPGAIAGITLGSLVGLGVLGVAGYVGFRYYTAGHHDRFSETDSIDLANYVHLQEP